MLIDELMAGTNPDQGAALARATAEALAERPVLAVITTHYDSLRRWARATRASRNAGHGVRPRAPAPDLPAARSARPGARTRSTSRRAWGCPLAAGAGARAGRRLQRRAGGGDRAARGSARRRWRTRAERLAAAEAAARRRRARSARRRRRWRDARRSSAVTREPPSRPRDRRDARRRWPRSRARARSRRGSRARRRGGAGRAGRMAAEALAKLPAPAAARRLGRSTAVGARVRVERLGAEGVVAAGPRRARAGQGHRGRADHRGRRRRAAAAARHRRQAARAAAALPPSRAPQPPSPARRGDGAGAPTASRTVDLRGQTGDDALARDRGLSRQRGARGRALRRDRPRPRYGRAAKARAGLPGRSPYVARWAPGTPRQGGDGAVSSSCVDLRLRRRPLSLDRCSPIEATLTSASG